MAINYLAESKIEEALIRIDLETNILTKIAVKKKPDCHACNRDYQYLEGNAGKKIIRLCGKGRYQFSLNHTPDLPALEKRFSSHGTMIATPYILEIKGITIFSHGKVIVQAKTEVEAKKKFDKLVGIM